MSESEALPLQVKVEVRSIPGHPGYFASSDGRIYSDLKPAGPYSKRCGILKELAQLPGGKKRAYRYVCLGKNFRSGVHQIVAMTFHGPKPVNTTGEYIVVRHLDNNPQNNSAENVQWATQKQNLQDRRACGTYTDGERNGYAKLATEQIIQIRTRRAAGESSDSIAKDFPVSRAQVHRIGLGTRWGHVPGELAPRQRRPRKDSNACSVPTA